MNTFKQFALKKHINIIKSKLISLLTNKANIFESINITERIWENKELLNWLRKYGIEISNIPPFKRGGSGIAYFLPNKKVLKFTDDIVEANIAQMIINSKASNNIISVKKIEDKYAILQEKLETNEIPENIKLAADLVTVMIDEFELTEFPEKESEIMDMCSKIVEEFKMKKELIKDMLFIINILNRLYKQTGFFHNDAGPTNIGMKDNELHIFDLGPNKTKDYSPEKEIEKIQLKRKKLGLNNHTFN